MSIRTCHVRIGVLRIGHLFLEADADMGGVKTQKMSIRTAPGPDRHLAPDADPDVIWREKVYVRIGHLVSEADPDMGGVNLQQVRIGNLVRETDPDNAMSGSGPALFTGA